MEFNYKGIRVIYNEDFDNEEAISDLLDEIFEFYYEDLKDVKVIDFSDSNADYFLIDGNPYQYSGGRLYLFDVENDEISESFKGQEYFEYRNLCKELGLETYDQILAFVKEHNCKNDQELLNTLRDMVKSKNECVDDVRITTENVNEEKDLAEDYKWAGFNKDEIDELVYYLKEDEFDIKFKTPNNEWYCDHNDSEKYLLDSIAEFDNEVKNNNFLVDYVINMSRGYVLYTAMKDNKNNRENISLQSIAWKPIEEDLFNPEPSDKDDKEEPETNKNEKAEDEPQTFEEKIDFLLADEQEAIDGYEKIIATIDDEHVKEQLNKIMIEEKAHKEYLEKVKKDQSIDYTEPLEDEEDEKEEEER